jgi:hypothetical protein
MRQRQWKFAANKHSCARGISKDPYWSSRKGWRMS